MRASDDAHDTAESTAHVRTYAGTCLHWTNKTYIDTRTCMHAYLLTYSLTHLLTCLPAYWLTYLRPCALAGQPLAAQRVGSGKARTRDPGPRPQRRHGARAKTLYGDLTATSPTIVSKQALKFEQYFEVHPFGNIFSLNKTHICFLWNYSWWNCSQIPIWRLRLRMEVPAPRDWRPLRSLGVPALKSGERQSQNW